MKGYVIDVRDFSEEKKKRVQDAFFKLGFKWFFKGEEYILLDAYYYANVDCGGLGTEDLLAGKVEINPKQKPYEITYEQLLEEAGMDIKPKDEVTITTTYGELLRAWAILGNANGSVYEKGIYEIAEELLGGPDHIELIGGRIGIINYYEIRKELEAKVFGPKETEKERKVRELREQAEELMNKAKELEETVND